jgi:3-hydroxyisobutyrate dehydrogenase-like beta-hydroxyacid dehydrogenase
MICLLGFGEVGQTLAQAFGARGIGHDYTAWDRKFVDAGSAPWRALAELGLPPPPSAHAAVAGATMVICAVTAAQDEAAARSVAGGLRPGTWFMDVNSASPGQKRRAAQIIEDAGGRYVEAVIMSPIGDKGLASPVLLGGPHAAAFLPVAETHGFTGAAMFSEQVGPASAAKLCRSVMIKGIEALLTEAMLTARYYAVETTVLNSLADFFPGQDWEKLARYMISRGVQHGVRRAEEMREAAATVAQAGVQPLLSEAIAARQERSAALSAALKYEKLSDMLDAMRSIAT